jgi:HK97 family phage major capsid protein
MQSKAPVAGRARAARVSHLRNFTGPDAEVRAYRFAHWLVAGPVAHLRERGAAGVADPLVQRSRQFCRDYGITVERAHSTKSNESGGFLIPTEFIADFIDLRERYGVFRRNAKVVRMAREEQQSLRRQGGLKAYPIGAGAPAVESRAQWDGIGLYARKWVVLAKYEAELSEDAMTDFGDEMAGEMAHAFALSEDECGFIGDGSPEYHGIMGVIPRLLTLDDTVANVAGLVEAAGDTWAEIVRADLVNLIARLPEYADDMDAKFYCSR